VAEGTLRIRSLDRLPPTRRPDSPRNRNEPRRDETRREFHLIELPTPRAMWSLRAAKLHALPGPVTRRSGRTVPVTFASVLSSSGVRWTSTGSVRRCRSRCAPGLPGSDASPAFGMKAGSYNDESLMEILSELHRLAHIGSVCRVRVPPADGDWT